LQGILALFAMFGMGAAIIKFVSGGDEPPGAYVGAGILLVGLSTIVIILITYPVRGRIASFVGHSVWPILAGGLVVMVAANLFSTVLIGEDRIPTNAMTSLVGQVVGIPVQLLVATMGFIPLIIAYNLRFLIVLVLAIILIRSSPRLPSLSTARTTFRYGSRAIISNIEERAFQWTDLFLIGAILGNASTGIYGAVWTVSSVAFMPTKAIGTTLLPDVSNMENEEKTGQLAEAISLAVFASVAFVLPILGGSILVGAELLAFLFQPTYATAATVLFVALLGRLFHAFHRVSRNGLLALNRTTVTFRVGVVSILVNIILNLVMIPWMGLIGAALATSISIAVASVPFLYYISKDAKESIFPRRGIIQSMLATGVMMAAVAIITSIENPDTVVRLAVAILTGGVVYWGLMVLINDQINEGARRTIVWLLDSYL
jgi:O-antigen/teichoic acid export membrane protein